MTQFDHNDPNVTVTITRTEYIRNDRESQFSDRRGRAPARRVTRRPEPVPTAIIEPCRYNAAGELLRPLSNTARFMWELGQTSQDPRRVQHLPNLREGYTHMMRVSVFSGQSRQDAQRQLEARILEAQALMARVGTATITEDYSWEPSPIHKLYGPAGADPGTLTYVLVYAYESADLLRLRRERWAAEHTLLGKVKKLLGYDPERTFANQR